MNDTEKKITDMLLENIVRQILDGVGAEKIMNAINNYNMMLDAVANRISVERYLK